MRAEFRDSGPYLDIRPLPEYRARFWNRPPSEPGQDVPYGYQYLEWQLSEVRDVHEAQAWVDERRDQYEECTLYASAELDDATVWLRVSGWDPNRGMWDSRESFVS